MLAGVGEHAETRTGQQRLVLPRAPGDPLAGMATLTAARKRAAFDDLPAPRLCEHVAELGVEASGRKSKQDLVSALEGCFRGALVQLKRDETGFTRYFYKPQPLRSLEAIRADIVAFEKETEGLVGEIVGGGTW